MYRASRYVLRYDIIHTDHLAPTKSSNEYLFSEFYRNYTFKGLNF